MILVQTLQSILFPQRCIACGSYGQILCSTCLLPSFQPEVVILSGYEIVTCSSYADSLIRQSIEMFKYTGVHSLHKPLGTMLSAASSLFSVTPELFIPIPLHKKKMQERGFNQAQLLATVCGQTEEVLIRNRNTSAQATLNATERSQNVLGAFSIASPGMITGKRIALVDDVITSGSTIHAAIEALSVHRPASISILALARSW